MIGCAVNQERTKKDKKREKAKREKAKREKRSTKLNIYR